MLLEQKNKLNYFFDSKKFMNKINIYILIIINTNIIYSITTWDIIIFNDNSFRNDIIIHIFE